MSTSVQKQRKDIHTRFGFAWATSSHASLAAKEFFDLCRKVFPHSLTFVLTDNGSEWKKHFAVELKRLHLVHYHTYPKTPKQNAHCERFNRIRGGVFVEAAFDGLLKLAQTLLPRRDDCDEKRSVRQTPWKVSCCAQAEPVR